MLPFRRILFPVDYSDACQSLAPHVADTVRHFSAQLALVHAYTDPEALTFFDLPVVGPELPDRVRKFEERRLAEFARQVFPDVPADCFAQAGEPGTVIHHVLQRQGADLIMLPTHGRGPIRRRILGSVAAKVLHDASCAVWTCAHEAPARPYRSIVCAVDDTSEAASVITAGAALAKSYGAKLSVVHVLAMPPISAEVDYAAIRSSLLQAAGQHLRETVASVQVDAPHAVVEGAIASTLHDWITDHGGDLLVTGRGHADSGFARVLSKLYAIVRESPCPVLSI